MYKVKNLSKSYDKNLIIDNLSLDIYDNKINSIIGRSGCGKTTLLNIISGLDKDYSGNIDDFKDKKISFIFQEDRLVEHLNVFENLKLVLEDNYNAYKTIHCFLEKCDMDKYISYMPNKLSGGMRQRINIIRAFITKPEIMLLDEPFKSVDIKLKENIKNFVLQLHRQTQNTCIIVEHDIQSVLDISDNINILSSKPAKLKAHLDDIKSKDKIILKEQIEKFLRD